MLPSYTDSVIISGQYLEHYQYQKPVFCQKKQKLIKKKTNYNIKSNINRAKHEFRRLIYTNFQEFKFITLTFKDDIKDYSIANYEFNKFIKKLSRVYTYLYIAVPEKTKKGRIHYHVISSLPYIKNQELRKIWGNGFIRINRTTEIERIVIYLTKYLFKDKSQKHKKKYFCSRNIKRPQKLVDLEALLLLEVEELSLIYNTNWITDYYGMISYGFYKSNINLSKIYEQYKNGPIFSNFNSNSKVKKPREQFKFNF